MELSLEGKIALVTGGGVRLGRAIVEGLAAAGARVAVHHNRSADGAKAAVEAIRARGGVAETFGADLTAPGACVELARAVASRLGPVDLLVNSAAIFERRPFLETSEAVLDAQWALNARAPYLLTQAVADGMVARGRGDVVNVLDVGGSFVPWRGYSAYCMSKAALGMLTQCLALELAPHVRVNGVAPGTIVPPEHVTADERERLLSKIPLGRFGTPEEISDTVLFLMAGPSFITGQVLAVDGGRMRGAARGAI